MSSNAKRELLDLLEMCTKQGGVLEKTNSHHYRVIPPDKTKKIVFASSTPGDFRSIKNIRAKLLRAGFVL